MVSVNLIPASVQVTQRRQRHLKFWSVMGAASITLLSVPLGAEWYQRTQAAELRVEGQSVHKRLVTTRAELRAQTTAANELLLQLKRAKALRAKRAWSGMIGLLEGCMPGGTWLTSVATDPASPSGTGRAALPPPSASVSAAGRRTSGKDDAAKHLDVTVTIDAPRKIRIIGYATHAGEPHLFVANLKAAGVFTNVALVRSQREPVLDGYFFLFELVCEW
ncbi:MAG: hypothetical protein PVI86_05970 [Phycisphaerae bacterium]|jgi:hypothetical protein